MGQILRILMLLVLLAMPVMGFAMPCKSMPQAQTQMHHSMAYSASTAEHPCPQHQKQLKQQSAKTCDGLMSVADCMGVDMLSTSAAAGFSFKVLKVDFTPVAVLPSPMAEQTTLLPNKLRAPPQAVAVAAPHQTSIVLNTGRFRI